jgi:hypothetical protein
MITGAQAIALSNYLNKQLVVRRRAADDDV